MRRPVERWQPEGRGSNEEHTPPPADPTGVKNAKNVPMLGQEALSAEYEKQKKCVDACVKGQPEAIAFQLIENNAPRAVEQPTLLAKFV